jgi:hypothetical protein
MGAKEQLPLKINSCIKKKKRGANRPFTAFYGAPFYALYCYRYIYHHSPLFEENVFKAKELFFRVWVWLFLSGRVPTDIKFLSYDY